MFGPGTMIIGRVGLGTGPENGSASVRATSATPASLMGDGWLRREVFIVLARSRNTTSGGGGHGGPPQREGAQHVMGEREPQQHGAGLVFAAHGQSREPHAAPRRWGTRPSSAPCRALCPARWPFVGASPPPPVCRRAAARKDRCHACSAPAGTTV